MSFEITEAFVLEFGDNFIHLSQQKNSRFEPYVKKTTVKGKAKSFNRIGETEMQSKAGRHSNTPQIDSAHSTRWLYIADWNWADLVDDSDKIRMLNDPTSEYLMAALFAANRKKDDVIIKAFDAAVVTGEEHDGSVAHPNSQKYAANDGTNLSNLNVATLIALKSLFGQADVDEEIPLHIAVTQSQLDALLGDDQVTSRDYNTVQALVAGKVDAFMGFQFHRSQRLLTQVSALSGSPTTGAVGAGSSLIGCRRVVAWAEDGMVLGMGEEIKTRISERDDKNYSVQPYVEMSLGAMRMEEVKVAVALCTES